MDLLDDGGVAEIPWAGVFDPAANIRALSAIQARGFRAATDVISRFVSAAAGADMSLGARRSDQAAGKSEGPEGSVASWEQSISRLSELFRDAHDAAINVPNGVASGAVYLNAVASAAVAEVWLHNESPTDLDAVLLRCSDLLSHSGCVLSSENVRLFPNPVPMAGRSRRGVRVEVNLPPDIPSGRYRGTLLVEQHSDAWLPVMLTIANHDA